MIHYKPPGYPQDHLPSQHAFLAGKWDRQQKVPDGAEKQAYDTERRVLMFEADGEHQELPVTTPPLWIGKTF